jgi:hypothetical protein
MDEPSLREAEVLELVGRHLSNRQIAERLVAAASFQRDLGGGLPRGDATCLILFAKVAIDRGNYPRASQVLAAVNANPGPGGRPFRTTFDGLVYAHCTLVLREALDPAMTRATQAEGSVLSLKEALDAELLRVGTGAMVEPAG